MSRTHSICKVIYSPLLGSKISDLIIVLNFFLLSGKSGEAMLPFNSMHGMCLLIIIRVLHGRLARWIKWRTCDVGEAKQGLENELWRRWSNRRVGEWAVTHVKRRKGWRMSCDLGEVTERLENKQSFRFSYVTSSSLNSPGEPPTLQNWTDLWWRLYLCTCGKRTIYLFRKSYRICYANEYLIRFEQLNGQQMAGWTHEWRLLWSYII